MLLQFSRINSFLKRHEAKLFLSVVFLNLIPILSVKYFPTVDGPAHLYNAKLILDLLTGNSSWQNFIVFNESFTPNWTGHLLLALLTKLFSSSVAEKTVMAVYLIGVPVSVRALLKQLKAPNPELVYLVFPFLYSYLFHFGFFNYGLAIVFCFTGLVFWVKALQTNDLRNWIWAGFLAFATAMGHPFVFGLYGIVASVLVIGKIIEVKEFDAAFLLRPIVAIVPSAVCAIYFLLNGHALGKETASIPWSDLLISFKYIMPIKGLNPQMYHWPSKILLYLFSGLGLVVMARLTFPSSRPRTDFYIWSMITFIAAVMVFLMPDYLGDAGLISSRLMWFFFVFLVVTLSLVEFPAVVTSITVFTSLLLTFWSIRHNYTEIRSASALASTVEEVADSIDSGSTLLPIATYCNRQFARVGDYAGLNKDVLLLRNYEAELSYFPLVWNYDQLPQFRVGSKGPSDCLSWVAGDDSTKVVQIDYVIWTKESGCGKGLECPDEFIRVLSQKYELIRSLADGGVDLYRRKK